jgi:hypothetical protein
VWLESVPDGDARQRPDDGRRIARHTVVTRDEFDAALSNLAKRLPSTH